VVGVFIGIQVANWNAEPADRVESGGGAATAIQTDVAVAKDVERMVEHAVKAFGRLDYAVNNAGIEGEAAGRGGCRCG